MCVLGTKLYAETLCMKGLVLTHLGRREEGLELVKKGVRLDLTSHICWHVFGLIQKGEKNYEEALKSYTQALRFDKVREIVMPVTFRAAERVSFAGEHEYPPGCCSPTDSAQTIRRTH
jgi:tetratricopeptide (TPR) repeat protein